MYRKTEPETIQAMFGSIATSYDRANAILSLGFHKYWNQALVKAVSKPQVKVLLDLCAGTGEIAFAFLKRNPNAKATLIDFCGEMLEVAEKKGSPLRGRFSTLVGDAQAIPLPNTSVDAVTIAYGIRNVQDPHRCFEEVYRVLSPNGQFGILELTRPSSSFLRLGHRMYLRTLLPLLGKWVAKDHSAYRYLSESIGAFISPELLVASLQKVGFVNIRCQTLMGGVANLILMHKPSRCNVIC